MAIRFQLNERWVELDDVPPTLTLLRYLRDQAHLSGTKEGCAEGDCGACCVALVEQDANGRPTYRAVNSCLLLLPMVQGKTLYTVEGIGTAKDPHPVQEVLAQKLGSQCGYCTPGIVMSLFEARYRDDVVEAWQKDSQMCGNLCRCTGYRPIRDACDAIVGQGVAGKPDRFQAALGKTGPTSMGLEHTHGAQRYFTPTDLASLWDLLDAHPSARFVAGGTDLSLDVTKRFQEPPLLISVEGLSNLKELGEKEGHWRIGAGVFLSDLEAAVQKRCVPLERMLRYFASRPIKNRATLGGNLCNASPIGDLAPVLLSLGAEVVLLSRAGERRMPLDDFFTGYRKTALRPKELLARIELRSPAPSIRAAAYKVSKRRELDISSVAAAFTLELSADGRVKAFRAAYGGMAATPARAKALEAALLGGPWTAEAVERATVALDQDFKPIGDHRASAWYRATVAKNLLRGFFEETKSTPQPRLADGHSATVQVG
jgi:xanthine dehydrogenase small subunit